MIMKRRSERGDTIIEVMFAMTIIGVVLGAAYSVASQNLRTSQLAKERTQATELAIGQLDQLKSLDDAIGNDIISSGEAFCLDVESPDDFVVEVDSDDGAACTVDDLFERRVVRNDDGVYAVRVEWIPPGGSETNKALVEFSYRDFDFALAGDANVVTIVQSYSPDGTSAVLGVSVINGAGVVERGVIYGTSNPPTFENATSVTVTSGTVTVNGLTPGLTYYARAYTRSSDGTVTYGSVRTIGDFSEAQNRPVVITNSATATSYSTATVSGSVTDDKGIANLERGIAYGTVSAPTITNGRVIDTSGTGNGNYVLNITGLSASTLYRARAYTRSPLDGITTYGEVLTFTTSAAPLPTTVNVNVRRIPPAAGNNTPNCSAAATENRSGVSAMINGQSRTTNSAGVASLGGIPASTGYSTSVTAPANYGVCPAPANASGTTGAAGSTTTVNYKIRPICTLQVVSYSTQYSIGSEYTNLYPNPSLGGTWMDFGLTEQEAAQLVATDPNWTQPFLTSMIIGGTSTRVWVQLSQRSGSYFFGRIYRAVPYQVPNYLSICPS